MGCCSSCLQRFLSFNKENSYNRTESTQNDHSSTELTKRKMVRPTYSLAVSDSMSAPTIIAYDDSEYGQVRISGYGLALINMPVEQDAAYWEWFIEKDNAGVRQVDEDETDGPKYLAVKFGVATKKYPNFYRVQESSADEDSTPIEDGTALMRPISVTTGDTVGIAVQQSDLPMLQFLVNGELLSEIAINRFRGCVFPSIFIQEGFTVVGVFKESEFRELSPHARFSPLMAARGII